MIVKRKLFSFIDEDGNLGYCLYNEATGEEKLFSVVEDERMYANARKLKKALSTLVRNGEIGKYSTKDFERLRKIKGVYSKNILNNPTGEKVIKSTLNKRGIPHNETLIKQGKSEGVLFDTLPNTKEFVKDVNFYISN